MARRWAIAAATLALAAGLLLVACSQSAPSQTAGEGSSNAEASSVPVMEANDRDDPEKREHEERVKEEYARLEAYRLERKKEYERWLHEHRAMGWRFGCEYETLPLPADTEDEKHARQDLREQLRCHKMMMDGELTDERVRAHWLSLPEEEQDKDWKPFNKLLDLLREFDGLRIYRLNGEEKDVTGSGENGK